VVIGHGRRHSESHGDEPEEVRKAMESHGVIMLLTTILSMVMWRAW